MNDQGLLGEIREQNLSYLLLAQKLLREDRETALFRLGMTDSMAAFVEQMSVRQLCELASSSQLLCRLAFSSPQQLERLVNKERELGQTRLHAAILLAAPQDTAGQGV